MRVLKVPTYDVIEADGKPCDLLDWKDIVRYYGCGESVARRLMRSELPSVSIGARRFVMRCDLAAYLGSSTKHVIQHGGGTDICHTRSFADLVDVDIEDRPLYWYDLASMFGVAETKAREIRGVLPTRNDGRNKYVLTSDLFEYVRKHSGI